MATRRQFFAASVVAATAAVVVPSDPVTLRPVFRKTAAGGWERVRMFDLMPGDVFRMDELPGGSEPDLDGLVFRCAERPTKSESGVWGTQGLRIPQGAA